MEYLYPLGIVDRFNLITSAPEGTIFYLMKQHSQYGKNGIVEKVFIAGTRCKKIAMFGSGKTFVEVQMLEGAGGGVTIERISFTSLGTEAEFVATQI